MTTAEFCANLPEIGTPLSNNEPYGTAPADAVAYAKDGFGIAYYDRTGSVCGVMVLDGSGRGRSHTAFFRNATPEESDRVLYRLGQQRAILNKLVESQTAWLNHLKTADFSSWTRQSGNPASMA